MSDLTRDDLTDLRDTLTDRLEHGFEQITARLDRQNGRVSQNEQDIAVLKDRSEQAKTTGVLWGSGMGATVMVFAETLRWWLGK